MRFVETKAHIDVLRPSAWKHKDERLLVFVRRVREDAPCIIAFKQLDGFLAILGRQYAATSKMLATFEQTVGHIRKIQIRMRLKMLRQALTIEIKRFPIFC